MQTSTTSDNAPREFMSVAEASSKLKVSSSTVRRMIADGQIQAQKAHDGLRAPFLVARADVDALDAAAVSQ